MSLLSIILMAPVLALILFVVLMRIRMSKIDFDGNKEERSKKGCAVLIIWILLTLFLVDLGLALWR